MSMRDVLGDAATDALLGEMHGILERLEKLGLKSPRPWREFWSGLKAPSRKLGKEEVEERIKSNFAVFKANYIVLLAAFMSMSIVSSPFTFGIVLLCLATFALLLGWRGPMQVLGHQLTPRDRMAAAGAVSLFFLVMSGALAKLFLSFTVGLTFNVVHMALRRRSGPAKGKTRNDEISMSQSNRGKDDSLLEDIESPAVAEERTAEGMGSYQKEAGLRASSRSSSAVGGDETSPRGA